MKWKFCWGNRMRSISLGVADPSPYCRYHLSHRAPCRRSLAESVLGQADHIVHGRSLFELVEDTTLSGGSVHVGSTSPHRHRSCCFVFTWQYDSKYRAVRVRENVAFGLFRVDANITCCCSCRDDRARRTRPVLVVWCNIQHSTRFVSVAPYSTLRSSY